MNQTLKKIKNLFKKNFFLKVALPLIALVLLIKTILTISNNPTRKDSDPIKPVTISAYQNSVAGAGVTEPKSELINIGSDIYGIVSKIHVTVGAKVKKGTPLFTIDDQEAKANYNLKKASYRAAKIQTKDFKEQFVMVKKIKKKGAISKDELNRKRHAYELAKEKENQAKAELELARIALTKRIIKSPIDGEVLKVNVKLGELYGQSFNSKAAMLIGDLTKMYVRVEVDEIESHKVRTGGDAIATLRGDPNLKIPLEFIRIEPYIIPKTTITGASSEKIDTRVLELIYSFDNDKYGILVGQQMDVYIKIGN